MNVSYALIICGVVLNPKLQSEDWDMRLANKWKTVEIRYQSQEEKLALRLHLTTTSDIEDVIVGDQQAGRKTMADSLVARGLYEPWDKPSRRLSTMELRRNGKLVPLSQELYRDVFNIWLYPIGSGTTPPSGSLRAHTEPSSGALLLQAMPLQSTDHRLQQTRMLAEWKIYPDGKAQRTLYQLDEMNKKTLLHRIGKAFDYDSSASKGVDVDIVNITPKSSFTISVLERLPSRQVR